jgi:hypothetical protein
MPRATGIIKIYINGGLQRTIETPSINFGGDNFETVKGHRVYGQKSTGVEPGQVKFKIVHMADTDLHTLKALSDATVRYECDSGPIYLITNARVIGLIELSDGAAEITMEGDPAEEQ